MTAPIADGTLSWGDFDLTGPLPEQGTTVLQASAGTGKTYAIASLAARYVAEGVPLDRILMVTFGRAATAELRDRVRSRLRELHAMLVSGNESEDPVAALLAEGSQEDLALRVSRLAGAVADFDSATISTTHGFCAQMLRVLGLLADTDESVTLVETAWDLVDDIAADLFVGAYGRSDSEVPQLSFSAVREIARDAVRDPIGVLEPTDEPAGTVPAVRVSLATRVRVNTPLASAGAGSRTTTISSSRSPGPCEIPSLGRSPSNGCGSATRWSSWTSSKTPIPSSGGYSPSCSTTAMCWF